MPFQVVDDITEGDMFSAMLDGGDGMASAMTATTRRTRFSDRMAPAELLTIM